MSVLTLCLEFSTQGADAYLNAVIEKLRLSLACKACCDMDWFLGSAILLVCALVQLGGCVMYPRERDYDRVTGAKEKVEELSASFAEAYEVAATFGGAHSIFSGHAASSAR